MKETVQIVGTSKSKEDNAYYIASKEKFWGLIEKSKIGKRYEPAEFNQFTKETGVGFAELIFDKIVPPDKDLKDDLELVKVGVIDFINYLNGPAAPQTIVFNGKTTGAWFFQYLDTGKVDKKPLKHLREKYPVFKYGLQSKKYNNVAIYVLPSTSGAAAASWDPQPWLDFWNSI